MNFLFRKIDVASLVFFRIVFGVLGFADVLGSYIAKHWIDLSFDVSKFQFKYFGFHWVKTLADPWLSLTFFITMFAGLGIALGKWYRWCTIIFALGFTYIFFIEKSYYLNHGYLTILLSWWIVFMPLAKYYSLDALKNPAPTPAPARVSYWSLFLLQASMGVVYFYGGIAKINSDWLLNGQPMRQWLKGKSDMPILGGLWAQEWVAYFMSWSGMLLDLLVVFFLINKRTRIFALFFVLFFHLNNFILFKIGIFPFLSVTLTLLYFEPEWPRTAWAWLEDKAIIFRRLGAWWNEVFKGHELLSTVDQTKGNWGPGGFSLRVNESPESSWRTSSIKVALSLFLLVMLTLPFRHHLIPGSVAWTEEGHRYSWRMMLRQKQAYGTFTVKNLATNTTERIQIRKHLTKRQKRKMLTHPEMILQFAHYLRDRYSEEYGAEVAVFADIKAKLNGRKYQQYIDPKVDLAKVEFSWLEHKEWVIPLKE